MRGKERRTRFSMILQSNMDLSAVRALGSSCAERFSNVSKKYEYLRVARSELDSTKGE